MAKLFFSYCHVDEALRDRLEKHLSMMKNQGLIETWHDRGIMAGDNLDASIDANLETSDIILLLVTADFLASNYCFSIEMKRALERQREGTARVIAVILEHCDWQSAPFAKSLVVPKDGKPVTSWANEAEAWTDVTKRIRAVVEQVPASTAMRERQERLPGGSAVVSGAQPVHGSGAAAPRPRSSNLRVTKEFTDFDKDKFLQDAFVYMGKFFHESLDELAARNPGIQTRYQQINAQRFSAMAYRGGKTVAECSVSIAGYGGRDTMLTFSYQANAAPGTSNEMLSVAFDSQAIFFKSLGMQSFRGQAEAALSEQGASEYYWGLFIESLQR
ncbi:MAG: hypothetical protein JWQ80_2385 [Massilia sp.]|nr:hypothetical protein [Massilia sp.]